MKKVLLCITCYFLFGFTSAQYRVKVESTLFITNVSENYYFGKLLGKKDTTEGYFSFKKKVWNAGQSVQYKSLEDGMIQEFSVRKHDRFFSDSICLECIETKFGLFLMVPRIANGKIELYGIYYSHGLFIKEKEFFVKVNGKIEPIIKDEFKDRMRRLLADDKELLDRIEKKELKYNDMLEIVTQYNNRHTL